MRENKKDKREHFYGKVHRKDRQLHDEMKKVRTLQFREFLKKKGIVLKKNQKPTREQIYDFITTVGYPHEMMDAINEHWESTGLDFNTNGHDEFCRYLRYHGHSNRGWVHAEFLKDRQKKWDKADRKEAMRDDD